MDRGRAYRNRIENGADRATTRARSPGSPCTMRRRWRRAPAGDRGPAGRGGIGHGPGAAGDV